MNTLQLSTEEKRIYFPSGDALMQEIGMLSSKNFYCMTSLGFDLSYRSYALQAPITVPMKEVLPSGVTSRAVGIAG